MSKAIREAKRYVKKALKKGATKENISEIFTKIGWKKEIIDKIIEECEKKPKRFNIVVEKPKSIEPVEIIKPKSDVKVGLNDRMASIEEKMDLMIGKGRIKKGKPFKLPYKVKSQLKNIAEKGKVMVIYLGTNRNLGMTVAKVTRGGIIIDGKFRNCSMDFVYLYRGKIPCIVLPEWDLNPIGTKDYYDAKEAKRNPDPQDVIISMIENKENQEKKKIGGKALLWILVAGAILAYVLFSGK